MANELTPQNDAEKQVIELLKRDDVRAELVRQELADKTKSTHDAVATAAPEANNETAKEEPLTAMPFSELATLLAPKGINLQQQIDDHVDLMVRRGIVPEIEAVEYSAKFDIIHIRKNELENIPKGYRPMLFVDNMTPVQAAKAFDVPLFGQELSDFTKRDPNTLKPLENQSPSGLARLTFTPDVTNLPSNLTGKSANTRLDQIKQGKKFIEPAQWFQMFAEGLEKAIKELRLGNGKDWKDMTAEERQAIMKNSDIDQYLPDAQTWTQFPDYRNQYGSVLGLYWDPGSHEVDVDCWDPDDPDGGVGVRPSRG